MTDRDLPSGIGAVGYEVDQMTWAAGQLRTLPPTTLSVAESAAQNAALESVLIHARSLIEFMLDKPKRSDDMRPDDFYRVGRSPRRGADPVQRRAQRVAQTLVHLSWDRVRDEAAEWNHRRTVRTIFEQLNAFADHLSGGVEQGKVDGAVVRDLRAYLLWARQEMAKWDQPELTPRAPSSVASTTSHPFVVTTSGAFTPHRQLQPSTLQSTSQPVETQSGRGWRRVLQRFRCC
jgi:hypothetical protein